MERKGGEGKKDLKKGWQAGSRGECLKNCGAGGGTLLYISIYIYIYVCNIYKFGNRFLYTVKNIS